MKGKNWWARLDPKRKRIVLVVAVAVVLGVLYLAFRGGKTEESPEEQAQRERDAAEQNRLENTYPSAYQYGYPGGAGLEGGPMEPSGEYIEGPEGIPGGEGVEGHDGPPGEPGPPGPPGPTKNPHKRKEGGKAPGGGHGGVTKPDHHRRKPGEGKGGGVAPGHKPRKPRPGIGQAVPVSGGGPSSTHPRAVNTGNRCINGGVGPHTAPPGYHLFCENGWIYRAPNN